MKREWTIRVAILLVLASVVFFVIKFIQRTHAGAEPIAISSQPAAASIERAFPNLKLERPVGLTFPPDGSNRLAVISQYGSLYLFPNDSTVEEPIEALNIRENVAYKDSSNEEGLLGIAFHPNFRNNREFFLYYTNVEHDNVLSRFKMSADDPNRADPNSEEVIFRPDQTPSWNHNGGTLVFGPDGFLYVAVGDGGPLEDPNAVGQNIQTTLAKILRINVDHQDPGLKYAIPKDNPFVNTPNARGEIWAIGLRNVWRMAFDSQTKKLWAGDVGQDTWEEIDIIERGGNYGWSTHEGFRGFVPRTPASVPPPTEIFGTPKTPIFAYNHTVGNCVVGGCVYRGKSAPSLIGSYLFADYVTGQAYTLRHDEQTGQPLSVERIGPTGMPILTFGEDETGEVYFTTTSGAIYRFK